MAKRALIVDDSRSARVILSRMLEGYGLQIDTCESGEQALGFLQKERPDVIFMDHLMPGMDGFQAVQAIKTNPATAMIPVIMYTSQEGELYASQARALGAVGVLPKTVKQSDVQRVLYQLRLLPERRDAREPVLEPVELNAVIAAPAVPAPARSVSTPTSSAPANAPAASELEAAIRQALAPLLKEHHNELRRWITSVLDSLGYRDAASAGDSTVVQLDGAPRPPARPHVAIPRSWAWAFGIGTALAFAAVIGLAALYGRAAQDVKALRSSHEAMLARSSAAPSAQVSEPAMVEDAVQPSAVASLDTAVTPHEPQLESVPYGEVPLAGTRVERLRQLLTALRDQGAAGTLRATTFVGDFCLVGNAVEGYSPAADELPAQRCDVIGNPHEDNLRATQRQSLAFANLIGSMNRDALNQITVDVDHGGRVPLAQYPETPPPEKMTAGQWNRIAERNNRVEFVFIPANSTVARSAVE